MVANNPYELPLLTTVLTGVCAILAMLLCSVISLSSISESHPFGHDTVCSSQLVEVVFGIAKNPHPQAPFGVVGALYLKVSDFSLVEGVLHVRMLLPAKRTVSWSSLESF